MLLCATEQNKFDQTQINGHSANMTTDKRDQHRRNKSKPCDQLNALGNVGVDDNGTTEADAETAPLVFADLGALE